MSELNKMTRSIVCIGDWFFFFQAEDGIRDLVRSRGLGDVYKRQSLKISGTESKLVLKRAMEPQLPGEVLYRPKAGFLSLIHI